jgi:hypothetical protein
MGSTAYSREADFLFREGKFTSSFHAPLSIHRSAFFSMLLGLNSHPDAILLVLQIP